MEQGFLQPSTKNKTKIRLDWDQKFLDFLRVKVWGALGQAGILNQLRSYGSLYNETFGELQAPLFKFAGEIMELMMPYLSSSEHLASNKNRRG